jgi:tetratricopeptide (TPR) repeat protein
MPTDQVKTRMNALIAKRKFNEMISFADQLIQENQDSYLGRWWKARALTFKGDTDGALNWFMEAMKNAVSDDEESKIASSMANVYNIRKQWEDSLNYTAIALELNPENVVGVIARSIALTATGKKKAANKLLDSNQRLYEDDYQRACVAAVKKEKGKMVEYLRKTVEDSPHSKVTAQFDPDFALYRGDKEFRELVS